ncbi:hypothetical protein AWL63_03500 [Sphingomonas panacis]|uniref:Uncharacterized protein n=1 Tax=Sphingomonas panacis TaxID=1560345 RepID=A0A1B3Z6W4_9SPHN|nr:hypothetical protein AWL63_03500 [Sphingomonas panacis]
MRHNEVMLGIDCCLKIIADDARATARARHGACVGIGQRHLLVRRIANFLFTRGKIAHLRTQSGDLVRQSLRLRLGNVAFLAVGTIKRVEIPIDIVLRASSAALQRRSDGVVPLEPGKPPASSTAV